MPDRSPFRSARQLGSGPRGTPLELLFDHAAVVAIGAAGAMQAGLTGFACADFMIWGAWTDHTSFASACDDGSTAYRVFTMVMMFAALLLAAGIGAVFAKEPIRLARAGFLPMRLALVAPWIGAARGDPERRPATLRHAVGIVAAQLYRIALVAFVPHAAQTTRRSSSAGRVRNALSPRWPSGGARPRGTAAMSRRATAG